MLQKLRTLFTAPSAPLSQEELNASIEQKRQEFLTLEPFAKNLSAMLKNKGGWDAEEDNDEITAYRTRAYRLLDIENSGYQDRVTSISERDIGVEKFLLKDTTNSTNLSTKIKSIETAMKNYESYLHYVDDRWKKINATIEAPKVNQTY